MQSTQRLRPVTGLDTAGRSPWFAVLALTVAAWIAFDIALVMSPDFSRAVVATWRGLALPGPGGAWLTLAARTGFALGGAALGLGALVAFARGVTTAPFAWLTPVLVGFSTVIVAFMPVSLPLPVSVHAYALASAFLLLGGGALLQVRRVPHGLVGALLVALPVGTLAASYLAPQAPALVTSAKLTLFVLGACSVGVVLIAMLAPSANDLFDRATLRREHEHQLAHAMQQIRASEERVSLAEAQIEAAHHSLRVQGAELEAALSLQDEAEVLTGQRNRTLRGWLLASFAIASLGSVLVGYFVLYQPLVRRVHASELAAVQHQAAQRTELQRQRELSAVETASLQAQLTKTHEQLAVATLALAKAESDGAAYRLQLEAATAAAVPPVKARPVRRQNKRVKRQQTASPNANSTQTASRTSDANDPIGGLDL